MDLKTTTGEKFSQIDIFEEVNLYNAPDLKKAAMELIENSCKNLIVSFKDVSYIDSTGIGTLILLHKNITAKQGKLYITDLSRTLETFFHTAKVGTILNLFSTSAEAKADIRS